MKKIGRKAVVVIDGGHVSFEDIIAVAQDGMPVSDQQDQKHLCKRMAQTQKCLMECDAKRHCCLRREHRLRQILRQPDQS